MSSTMPGLRVVRFHELLTKEEIKELYEESKMPPPIKFPKARNVGRATAGQRSNIFKNTTKPKSTLQRFSVKSDNHGSTPSTNNSSKQMTNDPFGARKKLFPAEPKRKFVSKSTAVFPKKISTSDKLSFQTSCSSTTLMNISDAENEMPNRLQFKKFKTACNNLSKISSSGDKEFIELERDLLKKEKSDQLRSEIEKILLAEEENFNDLKQKFEQFSETHTKNRKYIRKLLKNLDDCKASTKKKVAFVSHDSDMNKINPGDEHFEKAVSMYNSIRKNYNVLLRTPKLDRSGLHTPKSVRNSDTISRKLQKQCLLLQDTPAK